MSGQAAELDQRRRERVLHQWACHHCKLTASSVEPMSCPACAAAMERFVRDPQFEVFDHRVQAAFREAGEPMPEVVRLALVRGDTDWEWYTAQLFALDISTKTRRSLLAAFQHVTSGGDDDTVLSDVQPRSRDLRYSYKGRTAPVIRYTRPERLMVAAAAAAPEPVKDHEPVTATGDSELQATTAEEFLALLRLLHSRSGVTPAKLAERAGSGLPRSQAYAMVKKNRAHLPVQIEQVRLFATACGLPPHQVDRVVRLWAELRDGGGRSAVARQQDALWETLTEFRSDLVLTSACGSTDESSEQVAVAQTTAPSLTPLQVEELMLRLARAGTLVDSNGGLFIAGAVLAALLGKEAVTWYKTRKKPCVVCAGASGTPAGGHAQDSIAS